MGAGAAEEAVHDHIGHVVARGDEPGAGLLEGGALADRPDHRVGGLAGVAHDHAAALADREPGLTGEPIAGADPGGEDDDVDVQGGVVREHGGADLPVAGGLEAGGAHTGAHVDPLVLDQQAQHLPAALVELDRHHPVGELDHGRGGAQILQRGGGLEAQHTAADHDAADLAAQGPLAQRHPFGDPLDVTHGAIGEDPRQLPSLGARRPGPGAGGQDQPVVGNSGAGGRGHVSRDPVDRLRLVAGEQADPRIVPDGDVEGEQGGVAGGEPVRQVHPVVGLLRLLPDDGEGPPPLGVLGAQACGEAMSGHAAADHDDALVGERCVLRGGGEGGVSWGAHGWCSRTSVGSVGVAPKLSSESSSPQDFRRLLGDP